MVRAIERERKTNKESKHIYYFDVPEITGVEFFLLAWKVVMALMIQGFGGTDGLRSYGMIELEKKTRRKCEYALRVAILRWFEDLDFNRT